MAGASCELPEKNKEYGFKAYWDARFAKEDVFDWFHGYDVFRDTIVAHVPKVSKVLMIGCGNSRLSEEMHADGYDDIVNTDYSDVLIAKMASRCAPLPRMSWLVMDMRHLAFADGAFDCVLEKGTLDVFLVDQNDVWRPDAKAQANMRATLAHVSRVLRTGGVFVSITFAQPHFRLPFLSQPRYNWSVSVTSLGESFHFYVYVCVKGGTCEDLSQRLYMPPATAPVARLAEDTDGDAMLMAIGLGDE